jgi:hypothetical protein
MGGMGKVWTTVYSYMEGVSVEGGERLYGLLTMANIYTQYITVTSH